MKDVERKMEAKTRSFLPKRKVRTVADAMAPLMQAIESLREVQATRQSDAVAKAKQISDLNQQKIADETEANNARKALANLERLFE